MHLESMTLELEVDAGTGSADSVLRSGTWTGEGEFAGVTIQVSNAEEGHGFGLTEIVTIVVTVASGVASQLVADAVRAAVGRVIRRVNARKGRADGSRESLTELVDRNRTQSVDE